MESISKVRNNVVAVYAAYASFSCIWCGMYPGCDTSVVSKHAFTSSNFRLQTDEGSAIEEDAEDEGLDEEGAFGDGEAIPNTCCLFCTASASTVEENLKHMSTLHSFFVPDLEYLVDADGELEECESTRILRLH